VGQIPFSISLVADNRVSNAGEMYACLMLPGPGNRARQGAHQAGTSRRSDHIADIFRAKAVDSSPTTYSVEITGDVDTVEALINQLKPLGIKELIRTGRIAISRETTRATNPRR
jgi:acetolactate synthase small subunit